VTVVIPTKDRWRLLQRALASALTQVDVAIEVVVVDDGSMDGTSRHLTTLGDPRVRVVRNEVSRGVASARNVGVAQARADWVAFLDDDDLWAPHKLRAQLDRAAGGANFVYSGMVVIDERRRPMEIGPADPDDLRRTLFHHNFIGAPSTVMVRTALVRRAGGFDERLSVLADWDLWLRLILEHGAVASACREPLFVYAVHEQNMHRAAADSILTEFPISPTSTATEGAHSGAQASSGGSRRRTGGLADAARRRVPTSRRRRGTGASAIWRGAWACSLASA
jgi:glycosyltransferase involved in cell wall biosynthesis